MAFTADRVLSVASPDLLGLSQCPGGNWFGLLNIFFTKPCGFLGLVPCSCTVVYKLIPSQFIPVFLMGIEFELVMSRFLKLFLLEIFFLLGEENASLFYHLSISWILSAFAITAENPVVNFRGHNS